VRDDICGTGERRMKTSTLACLFLGVWISLLWTTGKQADKIKDLTAEFQNIESKQKQIELLLGHLDGFVVKEKR
jgi:uncharacterized protein (DUF2141 family)